MNGTSRTFRLDSTSPVSLLYSLVEAWVIDIPRTLEADNEIVLCKDTDVLERSMTLADYDLPNGDAEVSVVVKFDEPPVMVDSSSEDNEKDEAAASASSASETESRLEVDFDEMFRLIRMGGFQDEVQAHYVSERFPLMFQRGVMIAD